MKDLNHNFVGFKIDDISASAVDDVQENTIELRYGIVIGHDSEEREGFHVKLKITLSEVCDGESNQVLDVASTGDFEFKTDVEPYAIKDLLERNYCVSVLYGCIRPIINQVMAGVGFGSITLPLCLSLDEEHEVKEEDEGSNTRSIKSKKKRK